MQPKIVKGKRILIVDDDEAVREAVALLLTVDGHSVVEAENGPEGLALFAKHPFDLVILDYIMPGLRGFQVAEKIKEMAPSQPLIMITAYYERVGGSGAPVGAILTKPFGLQELRAALAEVLLPG